MSHTRYVEAVTRAKDKYTQQYPRAGVIDGMLTAVRHSGANNPVLDSLDAKLSKVTKIDEAKEVLRRHFSQNNSWDEHSFNYYLLDELQKEFPEDKWETYDPKPFIYFQGTVFIASTVEPEVAFTHGLQEAAPSNLKSDYLTCRAGLYGSTVQEKAVKDGLPNWSPRNIVSSTAPLACYVYEVNYRGSAAIDVEKTKHVRAGYWDKLRPDHNRINIKGPIKPEDIVGARKYQRKEGKIEAVGQQLLNAAGAHKYDHRRQPDPLVSTQELFTPRIGGR